MGKMKSWVVGMFIGVVDVWGVMSPIRGMVVIRARCSLWVVFIGAVSVLTGGEGSVDVGIRRSQWSKGEMVGCGGLPGIRGRL